MIYKMGKTVLQTINGRHKANVSTVRNPYTINITGESVIDHPLSTNIIERSRIDHTSIYSISIQHIDQLRSETFIVSSVYLSLLLFSPSRYDCQPLFKQGRISEL